MRNFARILGGLLVAATLWGASVFPGVAQLSTNPPVIPPRQFQTQQTHYLRIDVGYNSIDSQACALIAFGGTKACSLKIASIPANSYIVRGYDQILTNFNSGISDGVFIGTAQYGSQIMASLSVASGAGGQSTMTIQTNGQGIGATNVMPNGSDGGFDIWVTYNQNGTAPTAGMAIFILEYIAPNDGNCAATPMNTVPNAC